MSDVTAPTTRPASGRRRWGGRVGIGAFAALLVWQFVTTIGNTAATDERALRGRSSFVKDRSGLAALAELLVHYSVRVERSRGELTTPPDSTATVLLIDPIELSVTDADQLGVFVSSGGRLVTGGSFPEYLRLLSETPPSWRHATTDRWDGTTLDPDTRDIRTGNEGEWGRFGGGTPLVGGPERALVTREAIGAGEIVFIADTTVLTNELLAIADNAAFAVALVGERDHVIFLEGVHGVEARSGWAALPNRWRAVLGGLALAGLLFMWSRGTRFGPPEAERRTLDPPRVEYVQALAATLARTGTDPPQSRLPPSQYSEEQSA